MLNAGRLVLLGDGILDTLHLRARNETEGIVVCIDAIAISFAPAQSSFPQALLADSFSTRA